MPTARNNHYTPNNMIEFITGILASKTPSEAVIDLHGVGFLLSISAGTFDTIGQPGEEVTLLTRLIHREDTMELYGFATELERKIFDLLLSASGIGAKMAIKILAGMSAPELVAAISARDYKMLTSIPGLGRKRAEKLCVELEAKMGDLAVSAVPVGGAPSADAIAALEALGFSRVEAARVIREISVELKDASVDKLIRAALNILNK
ncbi:Holliday junction branch migration protein RuvA [bacterium]|nr:MAG: Holliday junction branch migration protein RuvA [bacterium]